MAVRDVRGTGVWPKFLPELTEEQRRVREAFVARRLDVVPRRYRMLERFDQRYPAPAYNGARTLEIGAGLGGRLAPEDLSRQDYYAVELRPELAELMRERHPQAKIVVGDCQRRLPFGDAYFGRVIAVHVLEHLPDLPRARDEVARVLADEGRFFVVIPCEGGLAYGLARRISAQRLFEREFGMSYEWFIRSEHVNVPWEIVSELRKRFRVVASRYFPLRIPSVRLNLAIGITLEPA